METVVTQSDLLPTLMGPRVIHRVHRHPSGMSGWNQKGFLEDEEILAGRSKREEGLGQKEPGVLRALVSINKSCLCWASPLASQARS